MKFGTQKDLEDFLTLEELKLLGSLPWICLRKENFLALFVADESKKEWEAHWWSRESAKRSLTDCREALKIFNKEMKVSWVWGITPLENKKALKMAKLLGCIPVGFRKGNLGELCLLTRKDL